MNKKHWRLVQKKSGEDILGMVMDFANDRKTASELMDKIAEHCEISFKAGIREVVEFVESNYVLRDIRPSSTAPLPVEFKYIQTSEKWQAQLKDWNIK